MFRRHAGMSLFKFSSTREVAGRVSVVSSQLQTHVPKKRRDTSDPCSHPYQRRCYGDRESASLVDFQGALSSTSFSKKPSLPHPYRSSASKPEMSPQNIVAVVFVSWHPGSRVSVKNRSCAVLSTVRKETRERTFSCLVS